MKKVLSILFAIILTISSGYSQKLQTGNAKYFEQFLSNADAMTLIENSNLLDSDWKLNLNPALFYTKVVNNETNAINGYIPVLQNGKIIGTLHFGKVNLSKTSTLNNSEYLIAFRKIVGKFDFSSFTGTVDVFDINRNGEKIYTIDIVNKVPQFKNQSAFLNSKTHLCDKNQNGNVTFSECYGCLKGACQGGQSCDALCDIVDVVGNGCTVSMAVACVYIAWNY